MFNFRHYETHGSLQRNCRASAWDGATILHQDTHSADLASWHEALFVYSTQEGFHLIVRLCFSTVGNAGAVFGQRILEYTYHSVEGGLMIRSACLMTYCSESCPTSSWQIQQGWHRCQTGSGGWGQLQQCGYNSKVHMCTNLTRLLSLPCVFVFD